MTVQLQPMKEEPPLHVKCRDKFLVQSMTITAEKEGMSLAEIVRCCLASGGGGVRRRPPARGTFFLLTFLS